MVSVRIMVLQQHTQNFSDKLWPQRGNFLKCISTAMNCTKYSDFNIVFGLYKSMFPIKNVINSINNLYIRSHKIFFTSEQ